MSRIVVFALFAAACGALSALIFGSSGATVFLGAYSWGFGALCGGMAERAAHRRRS